MRVTARVLVASALILASLCGAPAFATSATATGQVKKIDADAGKVTIKHGPIKALDMQDPMTMVYQVKDPASLKPLKPGDNVKFDVDQDTSGYVVTRIEKK
jgi:Cu(I)/Ag(I) efflux system periplasmic protein CusF